MEHEPLIEEVAGRQEIKGLGYDGREITLFPNQWEFLHTIDVMMEEVIPKMKSERDFQLTLGRSQLSTLKLSLLRLGVEICTLQLNPSVIGNRFSITFNLQSFSMQMHDFSLYSNPRCYSLFYGLLPI